MFEFYKELYAAEWDRRYQLQNAVTTPLAVLTVLGSLIGYLYDRSQEMLTTLAPLFYVPISGALLALAGAAYMLFRSYHGWRYQRLPLATEILKIERELRDYYIDRTGGASLAEVEFKAQLEEQLAEAAARNFINNSQRAEYAHRANTFLVAAIMCIAIAAAPVLASSP